ncbi:hypothetical protein SLE2022_171430 [Rubroshorea leprosula]
MDEERRVKENYKPRLMEEHEVPEWVYFALKAKEDKGKHFESNNGGLGKRRRKEVVYSDTLSDLQWMKAVENGEDMAKLSSKRKGRDYLSPEGNELAANNLGAEKKLSELRNENVPAASEGTSEETSGSARKRFKSHGGIIEKSPKILISDVGMPETPKHQGVAKAEDLTSTWKG